MHELQKPFAQEIRFNHNVRAMKKIIAVLGCLALGAFLFCAIWYLGWMFEFEYPYVFTLAKVRNAKSTFGIPISEIIKADGANWSQGLHWHTCKYCAYWCGDHENLISVHLETPDTSNTYYFAYCRTTDTLVPMTDGTATRYPSLVPADDHLEGVNQLNGIAGTLSVGAGDLKLPTKWFRMVTQSENGGTDKSRSSGH